MSATLSSFETTTSEFTFEDELAQEISSALARSGYQELQNLEVAVDGHDVSLCGRVSSYFLRQKAEFVTLSHPGVGIFRSCVEVRPA